MKHFEVLFAVGLFFGGPFVGGLAARMPAAETREAVGRLTLLDADGHELIVDRFAERRATAIFFLSARSPAVDQSIAELNRLYRKDRRLRVLYIGVCSNGVESTNELRDYAQRRGMIFSIYRDPSAGIARRFGIKTIPSVVVLDHDGRVIHRGGVATGVGRHAFEMAIANPRAPREEEKTSNATPIDQVGPKADSSDPYGSLAFSSELVFEKIPGAPAHHCSTITETPKGDLLCLWYGGSYESADDQVLFLARRAKGERNWQPPQVLIRNLRKPPGNGVIFVDGHGTVWIVWSRMESQRPIARGSGWSNCRLMYRTSEDDGRSWSVDREFLGNELLAVVRNPPVQRANGNRVLAVEGYLNRQEGSAFLIGEEGGTRWHRGGFTEGGSQPATIERRDGTLFALLRGAPRLMQVVSRDGGETWSEPVPSKVRNPDAGISMTRLADGNLVLVFNDSDSKRTPLSVARSLDEGRTWETPLHLESNPGEYAYPCVIQSSDGRIHVSYTFRRYAIKHVEFNEDWLVHTERPN
jgi:predicted neuraminidase